jgi:uroporphyrinogen decarboxylase
MNKNRPANDCDRGRMADNDWTSRKRIQTALRLGQPDRVPWYEHSVAPAIRAEIMRCRPEEADLIEFAEMIGLDAVTYMGSQPMLWGNGVLSTRADWESWVATWPDIRSEEFWVGLDRFVEKVRRTDLAVGYVGGLSCAMVIESWNLEAFCYLMADDMAFIREMFDRYLEWDLGFYEMLLRRDLDFLAPGNDLADSKGPRFAPEFYRQEVFPREKLLARNFTIPWIYHSCGNFLPFVEDVLEHGCNGIEPFQANAVDIVDFKRKYGHRVCVKGGVNIDTLVMRTPDDVEAEVRDRISQLAPGGGYIIASSHSIYGDCKPENVVRMAETIRK